MADSNKFGKFDKHGGIESYPEVSISGQRYEMPPTQVCNIGGGRFVVLDIFPPRGFDTRAEVEKLRASVKPSVKPQEPPSAG